MNKMGLALSFWFFGGLLPLLVRRHPRLAILMGMAAQMGGALFAGAAALDALLSAEVTSWRLQWPSAAGQFHVAVDPLTAWFLLVIAWLAAVTALYGAGYGQPAQGRRSPAAGWFFSNLLVGGMALVVVARDAVLFLAAWEIMTVASFFLVTYEDESPAHRRAGWIYLVASHLGAAFLLTFFLWRGHLAGSMDFAAWAAQPVDGHALGAWFLLAILGFGVKAGFMPLHVWLPEAHPAAPSHISALMSGVMIKTGIYGLLRSLSFFANWPEWWGWLFFTVGLVSGVFGILLALAQKDLKRLLAYSSVENMGIITLGAGLGLLGVAWKLPALAVAGWAGALLHVLNHALFKSLLFLGAGSVLHGAGTRNLEQLGGLLRRMPWTAACFLVGAIAIVGLPPLNGFLSEFLLYLGAVDGLNSAHGRAALAGALTLAGLALMGGLALVCFTKAVGVAFLGEPRSTAALHAHESGPAMRSGLLLLAAACGLVALLAPLGWKILTPLITALCPVPGISGNERLLAVLARQQALLWRLSALGGGLIILVALVALLRRVWLRARPVSRAVTWDCGYAQPTARMQYTASSFVQPLTLQFQALLRPQTQGRPPEGFFPRHASLATDTPDTSQRELYQPLFGRLRETLGRLRWLQHGNVHLYVLYLALTLLALLLFALR
ncbi:MAG: proton-conducting transporter membrane subunit [Verrucomicrobiae bacterium]|nr:proton-conducting transporter membrane subunit [Verrucomicrobiae bacterium]